MADRISLDDMTSDQLDDLYARAEQLEDLLRVAEETSNRSEAERVRAVRRADRAETVLERARTLASRWAVLRAYGGAATELRATLGEQGGPAASVQCWHTEADSPCDWDVCRQPERDDVGKEA